ncbi:hypothetical protein [Croceibacter atlanticus]|uniref:hypothetical protein n=1 Tax=Croceibacter atlanticus TaxID=313588 RepID=UPI0030FC6D2E
MKTEKKLAILFIVLIYTSLIILASCGVKKNVSKTKQHEAVEVSNDISEKTIISNAINETNKTTDTRSNNIKKTVTQTEIILEPLDPGKASKANINGTLYTFENTKATLSSKQEDTKEDTSSSVDSETTKQDNTTTENKKEDTSASKTLKENEDLERNVTRNNFFLKFWWLWLLIAALLYFAYYLYSRKINPINYFKIFKR